MFYSKSKGSWTEVRSDKQNKTKRIGQACRSQKEIHKQQQKEQLKTAEMKMLHARKRDTI